MNDLIKIKGGRGAVPVLADRELGYSIDEKALYIGLDGTNVRLCGADDLNEIVERVTALEEKPAYYSKTEIDEILATINARLDVLEVPETPAE